MRYTIKTCIILVNYNGFKDTIECIESLLKLSNQNFKIVICDNNSRDKSISKIQSWHKLSITTREGVSLEIVNANSVKIIPQRLSKINIICSDVNLGFAGGNNLAAKYAMNQENFDFFWFLNNDTTVNEKSLFHLVKRAMQSPKKTGIIGAKLLYYHQPKIIQTVGGKINRITGQPKHIGGGELDNGQYDDHSLYMDYIVGASMFVSSKLIQSVGFMNEHYFLYYEEIDWITRIKQKGWTIAYCPEAKIYHKEGTTTGGKISGDKSILSAYYSTRSSLLYNFNFNRSLFLFVFISTLAIAFSKLIRLRFKSFIGMIKGIFGFLFFILKRDK